jgi:hypothetical protein
MDEDLDSLAQRYALTRNIKLAELRIARPKQKSGVGFPPTVSPNAPALFSAWTSASCRANARYQCCAFASLTTRSCRANSAKRSYAINRQRRSSQFPAITSRCGRTPHVGPRRSRALLRGFAGSRPEGDVSTVTEAPKQTSNVQRSTSNVQ